MKEPQEQLHVQEVTAWSRMYVVFEVFQHSTFHQSGKGMNNETQKLVNVRLGHSKMCIDRHWRYVCPEPDVVNQSVMDWHRAAIRTSKCRH